MYDNCFLDTLCEPTIHNSALIFSKNMKRNLPLIVTILCVDTSLVFYLNCLQVDPQVSRYAKALSTDSNAEKFIREKLIFQGIILKGLF